MIELTINERATAALWMLETAAATEQALLTIRAGAVPGPQLQREVDASSLAMRSLRIAAAVMLQDAAGFPPELVGALRQRAAENDVSGAVLHAAEQAVEALSWIAPDLRARIGGAA